MARLTASEAGEPPDKITLGCNPTSSLAKSANRSRSPPAKRRSTKIFLAFHVSEIGEAFRKSIMEASQMRET